MKKTLLLLAVGALAAFSSLSHSAALPSMHSGTTGNNYTAYSDLKNYDNAKSFCTSKQGHLLVINNLNENNEIQSYVEQIGFSTYEDYWVGEIKLGASPYQTVTGQSFFSLPHTGSSPDGVNNFYLVYRANSTSSAYWNGTNTDTIRFICEFEDAPI